jgi:hypothetical protein
MRKGRDDGRKSPGAAQAPIDPNADVAGPALNVPLLRDRLAAAIDAVEACNVEQEACKRGSPEATRKFHALRKALVRDHMTPISRGAKLMQPAATHVAAFRMPPTSASIDRLTTSARDMAEAAAPFADHFVDIGLHPAFIARLTAATDAMVHALAERAELRTRLKEATKGIAVNLASARNLVGMLDVAVTHAFQNNPALIKEWKEAKRVRKAGEPSSEPPTPTPPPILSIVR